MTRIRLRAHTRRWIAALGMCAALAAFAPHAYAGGPLGGPLGAEVLVVLASQKDGPIDPSLSHLRALKHPPFAAFKSMKLLSRSPVKLENALPVEIALPNGRKIRLTLLERLPDGRAKVEVSINRPWESDYLPVLQVLASAGEPFFVAGQKFEGGTLVVGVRVGERAKRRP